MPINVDSTPLVTERTSRVCAGVVCEYRWSTGRPSTVASTARTLELYSCRYAATSLSSADAGALAAVASRPDPDGDVHPATNTSVTAATTPTARHGLDRDRP